MYDPISTARHRCLSQAHLGQRQKELPQAPTLRANMNKLHLANELQPMLMPPNSKNGSYERYWVKELKIKTVLIRKA